MAKSGMGAIECVGGSNMMHPEKGFTLIELVFTLIVASVIGWILAEMLKTPMAQFIWSSKNVEIVYLADLVTSRIESNLHLAKTDSIQINVKKTQLNFTNNNKKIFQYDCQDNHQVMERIDDHAALLSKQIKCSFDVKSEKSFSQVNLLFSFASTNGQWVSFYREVYLPHET